MGVQQVSHWHTNFSELFLFSLTSVVRIFMCRELVAKWSRFKTCLKLLCDFFFRQNMSLDCRAIVWRQSYDVRASVANMSPRNFREFTMRKFRDFRMNVVRQSLDSLENTCEHLATIWRQDTLTNVSRLSYE